jgi:nitrogen fixation protein NifQ
MQFMSSITSIPITVVDNKPDRRLDEFEDLVQLLMDHANACDESIFTLARYIAKTCCTGENHLWQDMYLPNRAALSALMEENFPALVAKNIGDMKWKKFFYRQLCERADILICKSPSCGVCVDFDKCFGSEEV